MTPSESRVRLAFKTARQTARLAPKAPLVIAVSGGVDSMVLLALALEAHLNVIVAHFDHRLRPTSQQEGDLVMRYARAHHVPIIRGVWRHPDTHMSEARAREARYRFLGTVARITHAAAIMTAHHADDQLETLLFRLGRSGHARPMAGIFPDRQTDVGRLMRPLLACSKADLHKVAQAWHLPYVIDASNFDPSYARNALRGQVIPVYKDQYPTLLAHVQRFSEEQAGLITLADAYLESLLPRMKIATGQYDWTPAATLDTAAQVLVARQVLQTFVPYVSAQIVTDVVAALHQTMAKRFDLDENVAIVVAQQTIRLVQAAESFIPLVFTAHGQRQQTPYGTFWLEAAPEKGIAHPWPITLRTRQPGDRVALPNGTTQRLRRFLINQKIPVWNRDRLLVLAQADRVYWIQGQPLERLSPWGQTDIILSVFKKLPDPDKSEENAWTPIF